MALGRGKVVATILEFREKLKQFVLGRSH